MQKTYEIPNPTNLPKRIISQIAEALALKWNYKFDGDLYSIIKHLGGKVEYKNFLEMEDSSSGYISVEGVGEFKIHVADHTTIERNHFTIAHELGHYVLHYLYNINCGIQIAKMKATRDGNTRAEYEANWFAAAFLMPESKFRECYQGCSGNVFCLADAFCVSISAATVRIKSLGLA